MPKVTQQLGGDPSHRRQLPVGSELQASSWHKFQCLEPETMQSAPSSQAVFLCEGQGGIPQPAADKSASVATASQGCAAPPAEESDGTSRRSLHATGA